MSTLTNASSETAMRIARELDQEHQQYSKEIIRNATALAEQNLPRKDDLFDHYLSGMRGFYTRLAHSVPLRLTGALQLILGSLDLASIEEQIRNKTSRRDVLENQQEELEQTQRKLEEGLHPEDYHAYYWILWLLGMTDVVGMIAAFLTVFSDSYFIAIVLGTVFGIAIFLAIKAAVLYLRDKPVTASHRWIRIALPFFFIAAALIIGMLRGHQVNEEGTSWMNGMIFSFVNLVIFLATAFVVYMFFPSEVQLVKREQAHDNQVKLSGIDRDITTVQGEIKQLKAQKHAVATERLQIRHQQKILIDRVQAMWDEAVGLFILTNRKYRADKINPTCFQSSVAPLVITNDDEVHQPISAHDKMLNE